MLFMVIERFKDARAIGERFERMGRMLPDGVVYHASWVEPRGGSLLPDHGSARRCLAAGLGQPLGGPRRLRDIARADLAAVLGRARQETLSTKNRSGEPDRSSLGAEPDVPGLRGLCSPPLSRASLRGLAGALDLAPVPRNEGRSTARPPHRPDRPKLLLWDQRGRDDHGTTVAERPQAIRSSDQHLARFIEMRRTSRPLGRI